MKPVPYRARLLASTAMPLPFRTDGGTIVALTDGQRLHFPHSDAKETTALLVAMGGTPQAIRPARNVRRMNG